MATNKVRDRLRVVLLVVAGMVVVWFAIQGGEFGTSDLLRQHWQRVRLVAEIDSLNRVVDSLRRLKQRILTDPATQERIAREEFGMVRDKELLYRIAEPPSPNPRRPDSPR
ncbi:MAG TPA: septum formation initiator family protein [Gemmatimonadaceae bacterium]|nr:septum formation initiator family protein [Gemmatimonadaceae bacterium]